MKVLVGKGTAHENKVDLKELARLLRVPNINKIIFHKLEECKILHAQDILELERNEELLNRIESQGNIVRIDRETFHATPEERRLTEYVEFLLQNPSVKEAVLENYFSVLKPLYARRKISNES